MSSSFRQTLPVARADGLVEVALRDQVALVIDGDRQLRQGPLRRSEHDLRSVRHVEGRLVARAQEVVGLLLVQRDRTSYVSTDLRVCDDPVIGPTLLLFGFFEILR